MYICLCHPFSDRDVKKYLEDNAGKPASVSKVYRACTSGERPQCCTCIQTLKDMIASHGEAREAA